LSPLRDKRETVTDHFTMKTITHFIRPLVLTALILASFVNSTLAQQASEVSIPDPGLNAAIREAVQKPDGPLNERDLLSLTVLDANSRNVRSIEGLEAARNLGVLSLQSNGFTNFSVPSGLTNLGTLDLSFNSLTNCSFPSGFTNLAKLLLEANQLTNFVLPSGLSGLVDLLLSGNPLTSLTLPPDMTQLELLILDGNPMTTLVLSEPLADTNLAKTVDSLRSQGVSVFTYPLTIQLSSPRTVEDAFEFTLVGPPGIYAVLSSADFATWSELGKATNNLGSVVFSDVEAHLSPRKFYSVRSTP
jgi:hypothetical protein